MEILEQFKNYLFDNKLVLQSDKIVLAVSGGRDSMLMLWLFHQSGFAVEVAHCNFQLRGAESDADEDLVRAYTSMHNIPFHVKHFDTEQYALEHKISIQMAARELRYSWFEELRVANSCQVIAVAHHKNDHVETVLFNLSRGTGLKGLLGIHAKRNRIIRPLLFLESKEITQLVNQLSIPFRDDSSNFLTKYSRNKIRLDIITEFQKLSPDFITIMNDNIIRFQESADLLDDFVLSLRDAIFKQIGVESWTIAKSAIEGKKISLLYLLFEPFGFTKPILEDLVLSLHKEPGRIFASEGFVVLVDRDVLFLEKRLSLNEQVIINKIDGSSQQWGDFSFDLIESDDLYIEREQWSTKIDYDKIQFPLVVRSWQIGDYFQPLGMKGKKKLSDLFVQRKVNVLAKDRIPVLVNGNGDIIWVVGIQLDDRYKIVQKTKKVLKLVFHKK